MSLSPTSSPVRTVIATGVIGAVAIGLGAALAPPSTSATVQNPLSLVGDAAVSFTTVGTDGTAGAGPVRSRD